MLQVTWGDPINIKVDVEATPFASGGMRKAYRGKILPMCGGGIFNDREKVVLKEYRDDVAEPWSDRYEGNLELTKSKLVEKVYLYNGRLALVIPFDLLLYQYLIYAPIYSDSLYVLLSRRSRHRH